MGWAYGFATNTGAVHGTDTPGQDHCACRIAPAKGRGEVFIAVVSDGAGSAECGGEGARIACDVFSDQLAAAVKRHKSLATLPDGEIQQGLEAVVQSIQAKAASDGHALDEYSCTLVAALASDGEAIFIQIGDGAAVFRQGEEFEVALWPEQSEYVNTTYFLTRSDAREHLFVRRLSHAVDDIALFSDGLQFMVLDFKDQAPHQPFFGAVTKRLCEAGPGYSEPFSAFLQATLKSPQVTDRTDDDTSIIVAKRRPGE